MNPQPDPTLGNLVAIAFVILIICYTIRAIKTNNTISINDNFIIGYLESDDIVVNTTLPPPRDDFGNQDTAPKNPPKPSKKKEIEKEDQALYLDCIDALVALGMKKREAKTKTNLVFSTMNPKPKTIQKFLITALKI